MNRAAASLYHDFSGLAELKYQAREDQAGTTEKAARQFESLFIQMMVKQMRQTRFGNDLFDSRSIRFAQEMYDQQLSVHLSQQRGMGMSAMLRDHLGEQTKQDINGLSGLDPYWRHPTLMSRGAVINNNQETESRAGCQQLDAPSPKSDLSACSKPVSQQIDSPEQFVASLWSFAQQAADTLGLAPEALLAQAALETGWGAHVIPDQNGGTSHNLFGIKADQRWEGPRVRKDTLEYQQDVAVRRRALFRCYGSYEESFQDYVKFLKQNPRYAEALRNTQDSEAYFKALQRAGYATNPNYANKILQVMRGSRMQAALDQFKAMDRSSI
jgi:flagellar protein FlgJ